MTRGTTDALERVDRSLQQAQRFVELDQVGEALARTQYVIAQCDRESRGTSDPDVLRDLASRRRLAEDLLTRLGDPSD